jgi:ubiquinone/menaquinone biosynthesis C-methylase UbiE
MTAACKAAVAQTYDRMADRYDAVPLWARYGQRTVERIGLAPGASVLDVGCGAGAVALPAAQIVGQDGRVIGVDLSAGLLARAREKVVAQGLANIEFRIEDMTALQYPDEHFDAVVSAFSIFFVSDIEGLVGELWRMVKPGGTLAITTWAPPIFEPLETLLRMCALPELPDLTRGRSNMDLVMLPALLERIMHRGGAASACAAVEHGFEWLPTPDDWWNMALGCGLRRIIASMDSDAAERTRARMTRWILDNDARTVATSVVYGTAVKPRRMV